MKSYTDLFFGMIKNCDHETGQFDFKLPKATMEKLEKLARFELEKTEDGKDILPKRLSLAERIAQAKTDVAYYKRQLKDGKRWTLTDFCLFEYRLGEEKEKIEKLKKRQNWLKKSHLQDKTVDIESLKQSNDLVELAESYGLNLKKRGKKFWSLCPFHKEKTASFKIDQQKQLYYCFGCGAKGDILDFVQKIRGCDFKEALGVLK